MNSDKNITVKKKARESGSCEDSLYNKATDIARVTLPQHHGKKMLSALINSSQLKSAFLFRCV